MRKLWPPTYDDCAIRFWAAIASLLLNVLFILLCWTIPQAGALNYFFIPGLMPIIFMTGGWFTSLSWFGQALMLATNFGFYWFVAWAFISMFRPSTNWWPEKPS